MQSIPPASQGNDVLQSAAEPESAGNVVARNRLAASARWFRKTATLQTMIVLACLTSAAVPSAMLVSASTRTREFEERVLAQRAAGVAEKSVGGAVTVALATAAHVETSGLPSPSAFRTFVAGLDLPDTAPGIRAIAVAPLMAPVDIPALEAALVLDGARHEAGYPPFTAWPQAFGDDVSCPTRLVEPPEGNQRVHGHDFCTEPVRRVAAQAAMSTGQPVMSRPVTLAQDTGTGRPVASALIVAPINAGPWVPGAGRALVAVGFTLTTALDQILGTLPPGTASLRVTDIDREAGPTVLLDNGGPDPPAGVDAQVLGRTWHIEATLLRTWSEDPRLAAAAAFPGLGLALGLLGARELGRVRRGRTQLESLVLLRTAALRRVNAELTERSALLAAVLDTTDAFVYATDLKSRFLLCNGALSRFFGIPVAKVLGTTLEDRIFGSEQARRIRENDLLVMASGQPHQFEEVLTSPGESDTRTFLSIKSPLRDATGTVTGVVSVSTNITQLKHATLELAEARARHESAMRAARIGTWELDFATGRLTFDRIYFELHGLEPSPDFFYEDWLARVAPEDRVAADTAVKLLMAGKGGAFEHEFRVVLPDGSRRWLAGKGEVLHGGSVATARMLGVCYDVTAHKEAEERLLLLMREVDHRAKNALAVVQSVVRLSRSEDAADFAEAVEGRVDALGRVHSLLAATRWSGADLERLIREELAAYGGAGRVVITGHPAMVRPDAAQAVSMMMHELATNAAKYGAFSRARGRVAVRWEVVSGCGELTLIWQEVGGPVIKGPPAREGFGLALLRQVSESGPAEATCLEWFREGLRCTLRLRPEAWQPGRVKEVEPVTFSAPVVSAHPGLQVLLLEDEVITALAMRDVLLGAGYVVVGPVARVEEALALVTAARPQAAVLDVSLFGEAVDPVADALASAGVPFLFCTGHEAGGISGARYPTAPVLHKPVQAEKILEALAAIVDGCSTQSPQR
jgi:PAS domain S-box-containing protein